VKKLSPAIFNAYSYCAVKKRQFGRSPGQNAMDPRVSIGRPRDGAPWIPAEAHLHQRQKRGAQGAHGRRRRRTRQCQPSTHHPTPRSAHEGSQLDPPGGRARTTPCRRHGWHAHGPRVILICSCHGATPFIISPSTSNAANAGGRRPETRGGEMSIPAAVCPLRSAAAASARC
jgi:hypothetical protein